MRSISADLGIAPEAYTAVAENIPDGLNGTELVIAGYEWYKENFNTSHPKQRAINGAIFECLILDTLYLNGIRPVYYQAKVAFSPNAIYDILLYHPRRPVVLSCKTSLRERWKQAALEGQALKSVYMGAQSYLLTLNEREGSSVQRLIGKFEAPGLDQCIVLRAGSSEFDELLEELQSVAFEKASEILPVNGQTLIS